MLCQALHTSVASMRPRKRTGVMPRMPRCVRMMTMTLTSPRLPAGMSTSVAMM